MATLRCVICGRKKYSPPFENKEEILDLCNICKEIQDAFIERRLNQKKDTKERRRKSDKK